MAVGERKGSYGMQQWMSNSGIGAIPVSPKRFSAPIGAGDGARHHRALLLIGPRGADRGARSDVKLARRVLDRLMRPAALVEGVDLHLGDAGLAERAAAATGFAMVMPPLGNLSNPFYAVHPRRNDRFLAARDPLRALFPEVDFAPFAFTGHALGVLAATCPERFLELREALKRCWTRRMQCLLDRLPDQGVLITSPQPPGLSMPVLEPRRAVVIAADPDDRNPGAQALATALFAR